MELFDRWLKSDSRERNFKNRINILKCYREVTENEDHNNTIGSGTQESSGDKNSSSQTWLLRGGTSSRYPD